MIASEAADLLTFCGVFDGRETTRIAAEQWAEILQGISLNDAIEAVRAHYAETRDRVMPADIRKRVQAIRNLRIARHEEPPPDADPDDPGAYLAALRANRLRLAEADLPADPDGQARVRAMIESAAPPKPPRADYGLAAKRARAIAAGVVQDRIATAERDDPELAARLRQARAEARAEVDRRRDEPKAAADV